MRTRAMRVLLGMTMVLAALVAHPAGGQAAPATPAGGYYLSLGDSLAFGFQEARLVAEAQATGTVDPAHFTTGYTDDFYRMLRAIYPGIQLVNLGCPGATSTEFLTASGCPSYPYPLHTGYGTSQLQAALDFLAAHPGQVNPITVDLGANDINRLLSSCGGISDLACVAGKLPATLQTLGQNLAQALTALHSAAPGVQIILVGLYNPYEAAVPASAALAAAVNGVEQQVAAKTGTTYVDNYADFNQTAPEPQTLCRLTAFCTAIHDIHATDEGYLVIARNLWRAAGYGLGQTGVMVQFTSAAPGAGLINFGTSCIGLVEVATRDLQSGGTAHNVYVTGNDLPGTVGDIGLTPGTTYYYETVTVGPSGTTVDNNGGKCYTFTVPAS